MSEQPLDLKAASRAVWKHRFLVAFFILLGACSGVAYAIKTPPEPIARALVLLPSSDVSGVGNVSPYTQTQIIIATSTPVLSAAGSSVRPRVSAGALHREVVATAESQSVLQIQVTNPSADLAVQLANAVANSYINYSAKSAASTTALLAALQKSADQLTTRILGLQYQINSVTRKLRYEKLGSVAGQRDSAYLAGLQSLQQQLSAELDNINSQIVSTQVSGAENASATKVLQGASLVPGQPTRSAVDVVMGVFVGLVAGSILALMITRRDHRLRFRDSIASAIGVPIIASADAKPCRTTREWRNLIDNYRPNPTETWNTRRILHRLHVLEDARRTDLCVVVLAGDAAAAAAAVKLAENIPLLSIPIRFTIGQHPSLSPLRAAYLARQRTEVRSRAKSSAPSPDLNPGALSDPVAPVGLTLTAFDLASPNVAPLSGAAVLAVSAGFATGEALAKVALAASDAMSPLEGIIVVNADPADTTTGLLPVVTQDSRHDGQLARNRSSHRTSADLSVGAPQ